MSSCARRWIACASLAGYVLALAGAAAFHDHAGHEHHSHEAPVVADTTATDACDAHAQHDACCSHSHHSSQADAGHSAEHDCGPEPPRHEPPHDEDCPICQFLALKLLPAAAPAVLEGSEPVSAAVVPVEPTLPLPLPWRPLSRGPPASV